VIIEFFGPPCVGKTTLANAVISQLRDRGQDVRLISSYRPNEKNSGSFDPLPGKGVQAMRRLLRPVAEMTNLLRTRSIEDDDARMTAALLRLMPPKQMAWKLRMYQYAARLATNWRMACQESQITLFDQGFIQVVYSLAVLTHRASLKDLDEALRLVPMPDLAVRLHISDDLLADRLAERRRRQGRLERLLEISPATNIASIPIFNSLDDIVRDRGVSVAESNSEGGRECSSILRAIDGAVGALSRRGQEVMTGC
jgi:thymidylate kinase